MDDHLTIFTNTISESEKEIITLEDVYNSFPYLKEIDLVKGYEFENSVENGKEIPSLIFAIEEEAEVITNIFKEVYENTYPYKQMESVSNIVNMIRDPNYYWIVFKLKSDVIIGCIGIHLNFKRKIANFFGFAFKKEYQRKSDIITASVGCMVALIEKFRDQILIWYGEARSSSSSIQYVTNSVGLRPLAFLPNKDIFFNHPESEILFVIYDKYVLSNYRSVKKPELISQAIFCYFYTFRKYNLELPTIKNYENIESVLNNSVITYMKNQVIRKVERDEFGNELVAFSIKGTNSYFQFQYYKKIDIVDTASYNVSTLEELYLFLKEIKKFIITSKIRYFEIYLSAYNSQHQAFFFNTGFKPTGYVPAFNYNRIENNFEDRVVFVYHEDDLDQGVNLIPETEEFLKTIKYFEKIQKK